MKSYFMFLALAALCGAASASTQETPDSDGSQTPGEDDLERRLRELEAEVARLRASGGEQPDLSELQRRIDLLAGELERLRTAGAASTDESTEGQRGFGPAASKVYRVERGVSIGGYGEMLYQGFGEEREDGAPSGRTDELDFVRAIVYIGYKFDDRILFNSEIEFEHASTGSGGEVSVEFAYLDFAWKPALGFRGGMLLVPVGFLNELHEPPIFYGARRPEVESAILPSTWRENGAGVFGSAGSFEYRAYALAGLSSAGFSSAGIRNGRQKGARSRAEDFALTGRLDITGLAAMPGLLAGVSFFTGESGQGATVSGETLGGRVSLFDLHAQYRNRGLHLRGLYAKGSIADVPLVNTANALTGAASVGEDQFGWYVEAAYDLLTLAPRGDWALAPYLRYESLDPQDSVPLGFVKNPATDRSLWTLGIDVKPIPRVVLKADYQWIQNEARTGVNQFNVALGFLF
jgi:hypothetical protein